MRITIDAALREQHGERDDDCEMDQRHEEERGLHPSANAPNFCRPERGLTRKPARENSYLLKRAFALLTGRLCGQGLA